MDNLLLIAIFITVLWLAAIGYYFYTSRQQRSIASELEELKDALAEENERLDQYNPNE